MLLNSKGGFKRKAKEDKETDDINDDLSLSNDDQTWMNSQVRS